MILRKLILAAFLAAPVTQALATGEIQNLITPADDARLKKYNETRKEALAEARAGYAREVAVLDEVVARPVLAFGGFDMTGNWQCRTIKAGGISPLIVYDWFKCRVTDDGSGWMLEKISGSQRTKGRFFTDNDKRLTYLGSSFIAGQKPKKYGSGPQTDQVGYAFRTGPKEWRIEFPAPHYESKLDILEFRR
ncbi:protein of unknown function [Mesorhizobium albiziae]|uniref:DUF4893 domain-containing protein n=1 Tax=Neomesorhizobium albiziae TaxID=335020 RepID=A0A1I3V9E7_9HYPH|nr:DUF4893 domain-containing protein [Mesorhizobium albiziae]GLS28694.1 DUF4893 domain-containing protein [Mesorhizobium albiziae]SFJ91006.1 protein of unknown function [Mesorhizobium albiziae]